ncbi:MAG: hypothetical protein LC128_10805 [Chitinophagales bacterium]|nr:hypothetical protein [Chitinophagales bacterium]
MKTLKTISFIALFISLSYFVSAQSQVTENLKVSGECGMCKKKIEKAAMDAGATYAAWDKDTKILSLKYDDKATSTDKIQQKIADAGYDTPRFKATDEAYNKLEECCQYEREAPGKDEKKGNMPMDMKMKKGKDGKMDMDCSGEKGKSCCEKKAEQ